MRFVVLVVCLWLASAAPAAAHSLVERSSPAPGLALDYPLHVRADAPPAEQDAARAFGDFLLQEDQQNSLAAFGFDRAGAAGIKVDAAAALALQRWAERVLR